MPITNVMKVVNFARMCMVCSISSHKEDRFGVAKFPGSNAAVLSTLLSCLLAVEAFMGKKINLKPHHLMAPVGIRWATSSTVRRDIETPKRRSNQQYSKTYAMVDVLRTSIYGVVSAFQKEKLRSAKACDLEKDWINCGKPVFGTRELLQQKLQLFLASRLANQIPLKKKRGFHQFILNWPFCVSQRLHMHLLSYVSGRD
ncbi:hypothetical protein SLE2022_294760 [Rubroshorea leprosula]